MLSSHLENNSKRYSRCSGLVVRTAVVSERVSHLRLPPKVLLHPHFILLLHHHPLISLLSLQEEHLPCLPHLFCLLDSPSSVASLTGCDRKRSAFSRRDLLRKYFQTLFVFLEFYFKTRTREEGESLLRDLLLLLLGMSCV